MHTEAQEEIKADPMLAAQAAFDAAREQVNFTRQRVEEAYAEWCLWCARLQAAERDSHQKFLRLFDGLTGNSDELGD